MPDLIASLTAQQSILIQPFPNQFPDNPRYRVNDPKFFSFVRPRVYHLDISPGQRSVDGTSVDASIKVGPGAGANACPFRWLPFVGGSVTFTEANGTMPILTGTMSGCWVSTFRYGATNQNYFAHLGTDSNSVVNTEDVKNAWKIAANAGMINGPFKAFNPANQVNGTKIFGALDKDGNCYTIHMELKPSVNSSIYFVQRVHLTPPRSKPELR